jgi:hypothetical protein
VRDSLLLADVRRGDISLKDGLLAEKEPDLGEVQVGVKHASSPVENKGGKCSGLVCESQTPCARSEAKVVQILPTTVYHGDIKICAFPALCETLLMSRSSRNSTPEEPQYLCPAEAHTLPSNLCK